MSHLVRFRMASGEFSTEAVADLDAAVARVEALRNDERADDVRVFAEVPLHFETYVKVSLATPDAAPAPEPVAEAAPEPEPEPAAPAPEVESAPEPAAEPATESEPVAAAEEATPPPPPPAEMDPPAPVEPPPGAMLLTPVSSANGDDSRTGLFGRS